MTKSFTRHIALVAILLALPQNWQTSFLHPDISDRIALSFFKKLSNVPWKRTGQFCPKRRDQENSVAGAEGELKWLTWPNKNPKNHLVFLFFVCSPPSTAFAVKHVRFANGWNLNVNAFVLCGGEARELTFRIGSDDKQDMKQPYGGKGELVKVERLVIPARPELAASNDDYTFQVFSSRVLGGIKHDPLAPAWIQPFKFTREFESIIYILFSQCIRYCTGRNFRRRKISYFSVQNVSYGI